MTLPQFDFILADNLRDGNKHALVSAPIMYVSAWLLTFPTMDPKPLAYAIQNVSFDISIISLVSLVSMIQYKNEWKSQNESENSLVIES